ncbi:metallophosphoesterase family protein [Fusibacter tunisiensis]|uniref:Icc-related predicted phosphoesterase n=1 Tax=Fusibacter tunisiensis TaxID=1008308 RepID=A0ABS2MQK3_9FIRM|nr:metallophosphoesterase family protein [Fusibacter tunisiensis]MBM7561688.1 Icc-related predicted phosphoesterase [Fusibacter tunisiensis]
MKILAISDVESNYIYNHFNPRAFKEVSLVLSAGDLNPEYLSFVASVLNVPVLYVHGNHDGKYENKPPAGCFSVDGKVYVHEGLRIFGLGGCMKYTGGPHQYTEGEMARRVAKSKLKLLKGMDILLTHAPAYNLGDGKDLAHQGFKSFLKLMDQYSPKLFVHGHQHLSYGSFDRTRQYKETRVINAYDYTLISLDR